MRVLTLLAVVLLAYLRALEGEFVWDDRTFFTDNDMLPRLRPWNLISIVARPSNYWGEHLPLRDLLFITERWVFGENPLGYHAVSLLLYVVMGIVLIGFLQEIYGFLACGHQNGNDGSLYGRHASLMVAAAFMLHPIHVESVAYITGQKDLLYGILSLLSLWLFARASHIELPGLRKRTLLAAVLSFYLSFLAKGFAVSNVLFVAVLWVFLTREKPHDKLARGTLWMALNVPVLLWLVHSTRALAPSGLVNVLLPWPQRLVRAVRIIGAETILAVKPFPLNFGYPFHAEGGFDGNFIAGGIVLLGFVAVVLVRRKSLAALGALFFIIYLFPALRLFVEISNAVVYDRYLFLPILGLALVFERLLSWLLLRWRQARVPVLVFSAVLLGCLCVLTAAYVPKFKSDVTSLRHAVRYFPGWDRATFDLAYALIEARELDEALRFVEHEESLTYPLWVRDYFRGWILVEKKETGQALQVLRQASLLCAVGGYFPFPDVPLARALMAEGDVGGARSALRRVFSSKIFQPVEYVKAKRLWVSLSELADLTCEKKQKGL